MANSSPDRKPERQFRIGLVSAAVFLNVPNENTEQSGKKPRRTVVLQRAYRDDDGKWKHSNSFGLAELPQAIKVLECAIGHVLDAEQDVEDEPRF